MIIISTGIPKSGTSLAFEMAKAVCALNGFAQDRLPDDLLENPDGRVNTTEKWTDTKLKKMVRLTEGAKVVVRTHQPPNHLNVGALYRLIDAGDVRVQVVLRDPRDTILSMLDVARALPDKPKIKSIDEGIERLTPRLNRLRRWLGFPSLPLRYEEYAFDPTHGPQAISDHLGVTADPLEVWELVNVAYTRKNVAKPHRHRTEMSDEDSARVAAAFPEYLAYLEHGDRTWIDHR